MNVGVEHRTGERTTLHVTGSSGEGDERAANSVCALVHASGDVSGSNVSHGHIATSMVNAALDGESAIGACIGGAIRVGAGDNL